MGVTYQNPRDIACVRVIIMIWSLVLGVFFILGISIPASPLASMIPCLPAAVLSLSIGIASLIGTIRYLDDLAVQELSEEELSYLKNIVAEDVI